MRRLHKKSFLFKISIHNEICPEGSKLLNLISLFISYIAGNLRNYHVPFHYTRVAMLA
jgi:hypothetical protein